MSDRHAASSWDSYLSAYHGRLADFTDHFVERDTLEIRTTATTVLWSGVLYCREGIEIQVEKRQRTWMRSGRRWVETIEYSYHVMTRAEDGVRGLFRYDNAHTHPGHEDAHHRHDFGGDGQNDAVRWVGEAGWPTLGDVIEEAYEWWRRIE
jgi:Family of unknown function (DUF6516)